LHSQSHPDFSGAQSGPSPSRYTSLHSSYD
jgi:hypothetical protein